MYAGVCSNKVSGKRRVLSPFRLPTNLRRLLKSFARFFGSPFEADWYDTALSVHWDTLGDLFRGCFACSVLISPTIVLADLSSTQHSLLSKTIGKI